jgi:hypothetical protein
MTGHGTLERRVWLNITLTLPVLAGLVFVNIPLRTVCLPSFTNCYNLLLSVKICHSYLNL